MWLQFWSNLMSNGSTAMALVPSSDNVQAHSYTAEECETVFGHLLDAFKAMPNMVERVTRLEADIDALRRNSDQWQQSAQDAWRTTRETEAARLKVEGEVADLTDAHEKAVERVKALEEENHKLAEVITELTSERSGLQARLQEGAEDYFRAMKERDTARRECDGWQAKYIDGQDEWQAKYDGLGKEYDETTKSCAGMAAERDEVRASLESLMTSVGAIVSKLA